MISSAQVVQRPIPNIGNPFSSDVHPVLRRVLLARGLTSGSETDLTLARLISPQGLGSVKRAAERLAQAVRDGEKILIVGDFDADGATGTALAVRALRAMGATSVDFRVPNRFEFGYGLTVPLVDTMASAPPDLIVTVDSGVSSVAGVDRAAELGSDVIVTDHHLPGEQLPAAHAIVNPNLLEDEFPSKALAGVGVVFYLLGVVRKVLNDSGWFGPQRPVPNMAQWLDLVALGTVADLVPLDYNNRVLVNNGVERIRRAMASPGIMAILRVADRDYRHVRASDLGFAVGPRLNAAGRLEDMSVGIRCLISDQRDEAMELAGQLDALNRQRRDLQEDMQREAMEAVKALLEQLKGDSLPSALVLFDKGWHQGVVGLVASRIKDVIHRPVVAFAPEEAGSERLKGSARSIRGLHIRDALAAVDAQNPGLMEAFGGHAMAAGLTMSSSGLDIFNSALESAVSDQLNGAEPINEIRTDGELEPKDIALGLALSLERSGPWGQRFPEPLFDGWFEIAEQRIVGQKHLKMSLLPVGGADEVDAIAFNKLPEDLERAAGGRSSVRMIYKLDVNRWQGKQRCQLLVEHFVTD